MNNQNEKLPIQFNWITKQKHACKNKAEDVSVSIGRMRGTLYICFTFRNDVSGIFSDTGYVIFSHFKNRIYLKGADKYVGYALSANKGVVKSTKYTKFSIHEDNNSFLDFIGDYELKHDSFYDLYYIENEEKTNEKYPN